MEKSNDHIDILKDMPMCEVGIHYWNPLNEKYCLHCGVSKMEFWQEAK